MITTHLLSRNVAYTALHGITNEYKDQLSVIKNQQTQGYCWAYALTSAIEMKFAMDTGNRLMLDPLTLVNNTAKWWKKQFEKDNNVPEAYKNCDKYDNEGGTSSTCALLFMVGSGQHMIRQDGKDSNIIIEDYNTVDITTIQELYNILDEYKILYTGITADFQNAKVIHDYHVDENINDHAVVLTSIGILQGYDGLYAEILNSWGYDAHDDGLIYIKIADSPNVNVELHNNYNMFDYSDVILVKEVTSDNECNTTNNIDNNTYNNTNNNTSTVSIKKYNAILASMITFIVLFILVTVMFIVFLCKHYLLCECYKHINNSNTINENLNNNDTISDTNTKSSNDNAVIMV